jgi:hypothetical protein
MDSQEPSREGLGQLIVSIRSATSYKVTIEVFTILGGVTALFVIASVIWPLVKAASIILGPAFLLGWGIRTRRKLDRLADRFMSPDTAGTEDAPLNELVREFFSFSEKASGGRLWSIFLAVSMGLGIPWVLYGPVWKAGEETGTQTPANMAIIIGAILLYSVATFISFGSAIVWKQVERDAWIVLLWGIDLSRFKLTVQVHKSSTDLAKVLADRQVTIGEAMNTLAGAFISLTEKIESSGDRAH